MGSNPAWVMDACARVYSLFVLSFVQVAALRRADPSSKEAEKAAKVQQRALES
jgi:hypothetical protein